MTLAVNRRRFLASSAAGLLTGGSVLSATTGGQQTNRANRNAKPVGGRRDIIVYKDRFAYCSHACGAGLANGEWIVAFNECQLQQPYTHPPSDPHFHNLLTRSSDLGETWSTPQVAPGWDWYGVECPGLAQLTDGTVVLNQWQFLWYPLDTARQMATEGKEIWVNTGKRWHVADGSTDWSRSRYPWGRVNGGCYVHLSTDGGRRWAHTAKIDTSPYVGGYTPRGVVQLSDDTVLMATADHPLNRHAFAIHSDDGGRTWNRTVLIGRKGDEDFSEPAAAVLADDKVVVMVRNDDTRYLQQCDSADGGRTWGPVRQTPIWGYPADLLLLSDSRLLCTYGHRREPYGIRACLSDDSGKSWQYDQELIIRHDLPNRNLGYPVSIEYQPGKIFTIYYGEDGEGVTCIQGSYWRLS